MYASLASNPRPFLASCASASVVLWCLAFERFSPRKLTVGLPGSSGGGASAGGLSLGRKLFRLAAASISVPSTVKCSSDNKQPERIRVANYFVETAERRRASTDDHGPY